MEVFTGLSALYGLVVTVVGGLFIIFGLAAMGIVAVEDFIKRLFKRLLGKEKGRD